MKEGRVPEFMSAMEIEYTYMLSYFESISIINDPQSQLENSAKRVAEKKRVREVTTRWKSSGAGKRMGGGRLGRGGIQEGIREECNKGGGDLRSYGCLSARIMKFNILA